MVKPHPCQRKDEDLQAPKRRVLALSPANQLPIHEAPSDELRRPLWQESERSRQSRRRREALLEMAAAATHLGLPARTAPSIPEFQHAAREADLPMTIAPSMRTLRTGGTSLGASTTAGAPETADQRRDRP